MRSISLLRFGISLVLSFLALWLHNLWAISADNNIFNFSSTLLTAFQFFIFLSLSYFLYRIFERLNTPGKIKRLGLGALVFAVFWFALMSNSRSTFDWYVDWGNFLAHQYGINWFWMDWGVWVMGVSIYLFGFWLFLADALLNHIQGFKRKEK